MNPVRGKLNKYEYCALFDFSLLHVADPDGFSLIGDVLCRLSVVVARQTNASARGYIERLPKQFVCLATKGLIMHYSVILLHYVYTFDNILCIWSVAYSNTSNMYLHVQQCFFHFMQNQKG